MEKIDTVGPLRLSENNRYILTIQDAHTTYIIVFLLLNKDARGFKNQVTVKNLKTKS